MHLEMTRDGPARPEDSAAVLLGAVRSAIRRWDLVRPGDRVIAAVSGGADSVALLQALWSLREEWWLDLHAAHFNHRLRPGADEDARFVQALAARLGVPCHVGEADPASRRAGPRRSMEDWARHARYAFLEEVARRTGAARVALAHTADDQAETVLMRLLRGAGAAGLAGMAPRRPLGSAEVIRPLLEVTRAEVVAYLQVCALTWREDETNRDLAPLRNRIRHEIIPHLARAAHGRVADALRRAGALLRDDEMVLTALAVEALGRLAHGDGARLRLARPGFCALPPALQRRVLREAIRRVRGTLIDLTMEHVERARGLAASRDDGAEIHLPGVAVRSGPSHVEVRAPAAVPQPSPAAVTPAYALPIPGCVCAADLGVTIEACIEPVRPADLRALGDDEALMDAQAVPPMAHVRRWRPGDRFVPLGMRGHKKLADFFTDAGMPREARGTVPLVVSPGGEILWVVGWRIADPVKVTPSSAAIVRLRARRVELP
ncbi:MAG: tRNA lysidine(34) synthetase TilS [Armatimonadetes bacterium]|nr:tRNA lysidine(34) synthetase TilS [Armatimonadota bacterium]